MESDCGGHRPVPGYGRESGLRIFFHLRKWRRRAAWERDMAEEFENHLAMHAADNVRSGMNEEEALRAARLKFGAMESVKENYRDTANWLPGEKLVASIRYGFRQMRRNPGFASVVVLTLAIGIGVNSAVFSALDAVILRPLPFPDANQLVAIYQHNPALPGTTGTAPARLKDWNAMSSSFEAMTGYYTDDVTEVSGELPERLVRAYVLPGFLETWRIAPSLGHGFSAAEQGAANVVLVTHRYWRSHFGANPAAVGQVLHFSTSSVTVAGVLPASFHFPVRDVDIFQPIAQNSPPLGLRSITYYTAIGRLRPVTNLNQARADLAAVQSRLTQTYGDTDRGLKLEIQPLQSELVAGFGSSLWLLFGTVNVLLLIACINVAALLMVRARQREREVATRLALGATKTALGLQFFMETAILAVCGAVSGLGLAAAGLPVLRSIAPNLPRLDEVRIDARIIAYSLAASLVVTLMCGLIPVLRANRVSRIVTAQISGGALYQWALVGAQISLAVVLLVGAGLLVRSLWELGRVSSGFQAPEQVLTFRVTASFGEMRNPQAVTARIRRTMEGLRTIHGVMGVATASQPPGVPLPLSSDFRMAEADAASAPLRVLTRFVSREYFVTLHIPILSGDLCGPEESSGALVNRKFADTYFPGASPVGKHILQGTQNPAVPITGVVADAREEGLNTQPAPLVYFCAAAPRPMPFFLVRTQGNPLTIVNIVRRKVKELEPLRSVHDVMPLPERWSDTATELRTWLLGLFSLVAVLLAYVGLYGTMSYFANIRRREIGVRMALGAAPGRILQEFLGQGVRVAALSVLIGLGLSMLLARWLSAMLFGVSMTDPWTLLGVCASVLLVAVLASFIPSLRASRIEAMQVLREE